MRSKPVMRFGLAESARRVDYGIGIVANPGRIDRGQGQADFG